MKIGARSAQDRRKLPGTTIRNDAFCAPVRKKIKDTARAVWDAERERLPHASVQAASEHAHAARHRPD